MIRRKYRLPRLVGVVIAGALLIPFTGPTVVRAAIFTIANGDVANLITAITSANTNGQDNIINLATNGAYTTGKDNGAVGDENALPVINSSGHTLTINGNGSTLTRSINTTSARFFTVNSGSTLVLNNLTLANGKIAGRDGSMDPSGQGYGGDGKGGAINNAGSLTASGVTFSGNSAIGGNGVHGVGGLGNPISGLPGSAYGGAINNTGTLTLTNPIFNNNSAIGGNATEPGHATITGAPSGGQAFGGAIRAIGTFTVSGGAFTTNSATGGTGAAIGASLAGGTGGRAFGGAISVTSITAASSVTTSTFSGNTAAGGTGGAASLNGGTGGLASGGAIDNTQGATPIALTIARSTFTGDHATGGNGGAGGHDTNYTIQSAGGDGVGGGISNYDTGVIVIVNSTLTGETATGGNGNGGGTGTPGDGGYASGGAIGNNAIRFGFGSDDTFTMVNTTIAANHAVAGNPAPGGQNGAASGGGLYVGHGVLSIANTLLAGNRSGITPTATANCGDALADFSAADHGYNLEFDPSNTCQFTSGKHDQSGDPKLDALKDNGGPTQTLALLAGSAAIANGNTMTCAAAPVSGVDQRGVARPAGSCSIGAFEVAPTGPPIPTGLHVTGQTYNSVSWTWNEPDATASIEAYDGAFHTLAAGTTTYTQFGIAYGSYGCLTIAAFNATGASNYTPYSCGLTVPLTPYNPHFTSATTSTVRFDWNTYDPFSFEAAYDGTTTHLLGQNSQTYTAPTAAGYFSCVTVVAYNASFASPYSAWACGLAVPAMPTNVHVTGTGTDSVSFAWTNHDPYSGIALTNDGVHLLNEGTNATSYTQTGLASGQYACIEIAAYNSSGASAYTSWVCGQA